MKAFSFSSILKNFGKQLSSLASQMPWCNLRFNLGSIFFGTSRRASHFAAILTILFTIGVGNMWGEITCKTITNPTGEVYSVTPATLHSYYNNGNGWVTNGSGGEIGSNSYYSSKSGSSNKNYIDPETESTPSTNTSASGITLKTADNRSARFYFTGAVKVSAFIAVTGSGRHATLTIYKKSDDSQVTTIDGKSYGSSGGYEKIEVAGLSSSESYYAKVTATNDMCLYAMKFFASSCNSSITPTLTYDNSNLILGQTITANPTLNKDGSSGDVTYSSSNTDVATVDENTGVVTAVGAGEATITATIAANGDYCSGEATVTITVNAAQEPDPGTGDFCGKTYDFSTNLDDWDILKTNNAYDVAIKTSAYQGIPLSDGGMLGVGITGSSGSVTITTKESFTDITKISMKLSSTDSDKPSFTVNVVNGSTVTEIFTTTPKTANITKANSNKEWGEHSAAVSELSGKIQIVFNATSSGKYAAIDDLVITTDCSSTPEPETYSITYECDGATSGCPSNATEQTALPNPLPSAPTKTGYTFDGWYTDAEKTIQAVAGAMLEENTTLYAKWNCTAPIFDIKIKDDNPVVFSGESIELTVVGSNIAADATYQWYKYNGATYDELTGQITDELIIANATANDAGNYKCVVTNGTCSGENNYTVKMYHIKGLTDNTWTTPFEFEKSGNKEGTFSVELAASTTYYFKLNDGSVWYWNEGTMTHNNCTDWVIEQEGADTQGKANTGITTTASGTYTFTLDYEDPSKPKLSVTYPAKKIVYLNTGDWNCSKYAVYSWEGENNSTVLMTKIDDCAGRNIYQAEIEASHSNVIFIGGTASYDVANTWNNVSYQTIDLTYPSDDNVLYEINTTHLFLTPNGNWKTDGARFAAYFFGNGETWVSMTKVTGDLYKVTIPTTKTYPSVIFCRMNPSAAANNWDNKWNQSADLIITKGKNHYTVSEGAWDKGEGTWKTAGDWTALTPNYTVTFDANGYGTATDAQCVAKNGMATTPTAPTATGYTFGGWYTDQTCTNTYDFNANITSDITLYAKWTANNYTVSFDLQGHGETITDQTINYGGKATQPTTPTATGYTFAGWYKDADCTNAWNFETDVVTENITLYAKWEEEVTLTAIITYTLNVGTSANTTIKNNVSTTDATNITDIDIDQTNDGANGAGASNRTTKLALATGESAASVDNPDKYELFTFKVACGKKLTPSEVKIKVANVGGTAGGYQNYKAVLSDAYGHSISNTFTGMNSDGTVEEFSITNGGGTYFQGNVTLKLWSCKGASGNASAFRMGTPLEIFGEVGAQATPAATITWNTQPANGQVGDPDFAYAVSCSDGSAVTVTSDDTNIATIEDGKLHYVAEGTTHLVATATDACGNTITQISNDFTVTAASDDPDPEPGECVTIFEAKATSTTTFEATTGDITSSNFVEGNELNIDGYQFAVKPNSTSALVIALEEDEVFKVGDKLTFVVYTAKDKEIGFKIGDNTYTQSVSKSLYYFEQELTDTDITDGATTITFNRNSSDDRWVAVKIERCEDLPSCTTPELDNLTNQIVCPGEDVSWTAIVNNTEDLADGETITYQWTKNSTVLSNNATLTLNDITEAAGGTYVVTATVSAEGKASKTASKEVTLTVRPATATPTITANANTIYTGNDVTLTASCASSGVGYQWYTCTDAEGTNPQAIDGATNATYTLTAGEAGTYYYKVIVTGDGTHSCGTAEKVYTLVISPAAGGDCETEFWFAEAADKPESATAATHITGTPSGSSSATYTATIDGNSYPITGQTGQKTGNVTIVVPEDNEGTLYVVVQGSSSRTITLSKGGVQVGQYTPANSTWGTFTFSSLDEGTYTLVSSGNIGWGIIALKLCSGKACTDPEVTASVNNSTACVGSSVTFTAAGAHAEASYQWQKYSGGAWTNIDYATASTYNIASVATTDAMKYRVIANNDCDRTSNEVTLNVPVAPVFGSFTATRSVMATLALSITDVEASDATSYTWYKSADATYDAGTDTKVGTSKELLLAAGGEAAGATYYLFCVASNSCGSTTSGAITVNVTALVVEECATKGNEGEHEFGFVNTDCSSDTYGDSKTPVWKTSLRSKYLTYTAPKGKYFATVKVTVAHTGGTKCGYAYSTNGGTTWVVAELGGLSATLTAITIELPANVNAFRISRNLTAQDGEKGSDSGNFYLSEACFTYENACTPTSVTPTTTSFEYNMSVQMDFVEPTFTVKHGEEVVNDAVLTYTSSNPAIATVDEEGSVTFEGMTGTVTITAAYAGTTIDEIEYCASEGSYTITVGCQDQEPKIKEADGTNLDGCNNSITLEAKDKDGNSFTGGTYQWYRDGEAIDGATSASYEVVRAGTYTVSRTYTCTTMSSNSAVVTNENPEPKVERLTPFQYYHVDKDYSDQMKDRHLFAVTSYGTLDDGKRYHLTATRNGDALVLSSSTAFFTTQSSDNAVDTVMIDLNELKGKYSANDEIVITCAPINNCNQVSTITSSITIHVIDETPTLALICSGANGDGTRDTEKLVVGGDFLTGYNKADLCQQTGNKTFDPNTEWRFYEALQDSFIVTPVNGYAQFNKLNYEPFDILLLTDYPKSSKSEAAQKIIDDMAELCDYRPLLSFKTHFQSDKWKDKTTGEYKYTKWVKKGFTTAPVVPKQTATYVNIVCYAHPMFEDIDDINDQYTFHDHDDPNQLVYQVLTGPGYEGSKGIQGFELADADNFVTIGLVHYNAIADSVTHDGHTHISWNAEANDRLLVAMAERKTNIEARMMLFSLNCGAQSLQTPGGRNVILKCLEYLLETDPLKVADCRFTFDNGAGNTDFDPEKYEGTGVKGDSLWSTAANWGPDYIVVPGRNNDVRIAAPCIVDGVKTKVSVGDEVQETIQYYPEVLSIHITENGSLTIPANSSLTARSTILRADEKGNVYPTNVADISLGSNADGNASLILNNERGDTKAGVAMYSKAEADTANMSAATSTWQYIGTPHTDVQNAIYNYYDSWLYQYDTETQGWIVIPKGGPLVPFRGYCITHPERGHTYWMEGTLAATTNQDITIPKGKFVVVANSWTAPIQINELTDDDMEGLTDKSIYFFNTGSDPEGDNSLTANATGDAARWAPSTYISVPIHAADYTEKDANIPSMQGFYVVGDKEADGTLHLDYERHVRAKRENVPSGPMHAPARIADTDNEPQVAKFLFRGKRYDDRLIILERPDFTRGYDSGWDGEQWGGNAAAPMSYVVAETRYDAVSAIPEYEGTVIGFRAGEDNIYTIHFDYDGMEEALYLLDTETKIYTRVLKGNSYTFACPDKAEHNRFILTRKAPQIATGTENIATGENAKAVKFIKDDKIFIFVNGILYDATGKMVIR